MKTDMETLQPERDWRDEQLADNAWKNLSIDQQAWELAKLCLPEGSVAEQIIRAQQIKLSILAGELEIEVIA